MANRRGKKFDLEDRLIDFGVEIIRMAEKMPRTRSGIHIGGQVMRSGTSPAADYGEAQSAESSTDFLHKLKLCLKELRETRIWLKMIIRANLADSEKMQNIIQECDELISIFVASIRTSINKKRRTPGQEPKALPL